MGGLITCQQLNVQREKKLYLGLCIWKQINNHVQLFKILLRQNDEVKPTTFEVHIEHLPQQPNSFDCGIMVFKCGMELKNMMRKPCLLTLVVEML
ncbi:hypothetical protein DEO72_LG9g1272 [Vigna unguiculata]|uniref:Ulp1 protease family n=1 Tax=Vigna unguiculata TaxID=3917 RepID=A0A4D6N088_VIGUN|nr:hypothetical protein DEO72_LG9g1272 [Vigna unguiculata]